MAGLPAQGEKDWCEECQRMRTVADSDVDEAIVGGGYGYSRTQEYAWVAFRECGHTNQIQVGGERKVYD